MEEDFWTKLKRKGREQPLLYIGIVGCFGTAGYGLYNFKKRTTSASLFLTRLRVVAQGVFVASLTIAVFVDMYKKHIQPNVFKAIEDKPSIDDTSKK